RRGHLVLEFAADQHHPALLLLRSARGDARTGAAQDRAGYRPEPWSLRASARIGAFGTEPESGALQNPGKKRRNFSGNRSHAGAGDAEYLGDSAGCAQSTSAARREPHEGKIAIVIFEKWHLGRACGARRTGKGNRC